MAPFQAHSKTSREAALLVTPKISERAQLLLKTLAATNGMTDLEGQEWLKMLGDSYRPVRVRLVRDGLVESSGLTRTTQSGKAAVVWAVTQKGQELLEEMKWKQ